MNTIADVVRKLKAKSITSQPQKETEIKIIRDEDWLQARLEVDQLSANYESIFENHASKTNVKRMGKYERMLAEFNPVGKFRLELLAYIPTEGGEAKAWYCLFNKQHSVVYLRSLTDI